MSETVPTRARPWDRWWSHPVVLRLLGRLPPGALLLAVLTFASYAVGLVRDRVFARTFGAGSDLDVYNAALILPELVLDMLVFAGLSAAFVPVLLRTERDDRAVGGAFARTVVTASSVVMAVAVAVLYLIAPWTARFIAPGFDAQEVVLYTSLFRQMCATALVFAVSFALGELLVARQRFLAYGLAPLLYNLGIVLGALLLAPRIGIEGVAIGTLVGSLLHLGIRVVGVHRAGFQYRPTLAIGTREFREYVRLSIPRAVAQPIEALTFLFFTSVASGMATGSVSSLSFARNFQSVPVSLIGMAFSVAAFPVLSRVAATGDRARFRRLVRDNLLTVGTLSVAAAVVLALAAGVAIRIFLGGDQFDDEDITRTTALLTILAISVPLEALSHVLTRAIFATHHTLLPVVSSVVGLLVIIGTVQLLRPTYGLSALPLGFVAGMSVKVLILLVTLRRRIGRMAADGQQPSTGQ
jgi:putative peptidoglycan lipid II flippase